MGVEAIHGQQVEGAAVQILMAGMIYNDRVLCVLVLRIKLAQLVLNCRMILVGFGQPNLNQMVLVIDDNVQIKSRSLIVPYPLTMVAMHDRVILYVTDINRILIKSDADHMIRIHHARWNGRSTRT